jgi:hypothetical protein
MRALRQFFSKLVRFMEADGRVEIELGPHHADAGDY